MMPGDIVWHCWIKGGGEPSLIEFIVIGPLNGHPQDPAILVRPANVIWPPKNSPSLEEDFSHPKCYWHSELHKTPEEAIRQRIASLESIIQKLKEMLND